MKKQLYLLLSAGFISFTLFACTRPSANEVATKFCSMMEKKHNAATEDEKKKIGEEMKAYEKKIKSAYRDQDYQTAIQKAIHECMDELDAKYGNVEQ